MKCSLGVSNFLEEISSLSHSTVFLNFFTLIIEEGFLISPCYSLELLFTWGQTVMEVMKVMGTSFKRSHVLLLHSVPPTLQQATTNPPLHWRLLDTHRQVWVNLLWGHCSFFLDSGVHKVLFVPSKSLFPQSCVSSGAS